MATIAISQSSSFASDSSKAKTPAASIFAMLDRKSKIDPSDEAGMTLESIKRAIELNHVSFKYPIRPDIQIFQDLSLAIHSGKEPVLFNDTIRSNIAYGKEGNARAAEIIDATELANAHKFISGLQHTVVIVAHRLSTIKGADVIDVVKNGVIAEKRKHESLVNVKDGFYASLVAIHMSASC
ncbi:ABC transporter B family member 21-like [Olea europaea subsp. europaea]|uniref:ABC transporter B family member 21-like n=1 Tax=Olea europaea subsp. europaea TaxID=158383 RepID=A0A8S0TXR2_OLEEU|nr:ABC transporter B family member 21-like [Olea europaea subsp. europaea]